MPPPRSESFEMESLREKLLRRSMDNSFSDAEHSEDEDDILVHRSDEGPSNEDRELLNEEDEREKLLTKKRKVIIGKHSRRKSTENYMETGQLDTIVNKVRKIKKRKCSAKRLICCHCIVFWLIILGLAIALIVRVFSRPARRPPRQNVKILSNGTHSFQPTVLIVSLDGFRPDYIDRDLTPNLHKLREMGVAPEYMKPSFPTVTFPNHYSIVTGLYPESHGVVGNIYYDPETMSVFDITNPAKSLAPWWWEGTSGGLVEPIWVTAEQQGIISAIHMWPGSESVIHGVQATYVDRFKQFESLSVKVDRILSWIDMDDLSRPGFLAAYVPDIDSIGHSYGPDGPEMNQSLAKIDEMIGSIMDGLDQRNLTNIINFIIVSDHGMAATSKDRVVFLDQFMDLNEIEYYDCWPLRGLRPYSDQNITAIYEHLKSQSEGQPWSVYLRDEDMPERWHFSATYRIAPIWVIPDPGWVVVLGKGEFDPEEDDEYHPKGLHGYDNDNELMRSLFVARGPGFNYTYPVQPFENVEVYGMMTNILGLKPNPNNGTLPRGRMQRLPSTDVATVPSSTGNDTSTIGIGEEDDDLPEMSPEDWEIIEDYIAEEDAHDRPLTWKEYLEIKAEEMRQEMEMWWDWLKHGGGGRRV